MWMFTCVKENAFHRPHNSWLTEEVVHDVVPFRVEPARFPKDLIIFDTEGFSNEHPERHARCHEPLSHKPSRNGLLPSLFGLIEATSNAAAETVVFWAWDSARPRVAWSKPNTTGEARASNPSAVSKGFLLISSLCARRSFMCSIHC